MLQLSIAKSKEFQKPQSQYDSSYPSEWRGSGSERLLATFQHIMNLPDNHLNPITTRRNLALLPEVNANFPEGTLDTVLVTHVESPDEFYIVMKTKANYSLDHPEWTKYFPAFNNGFEALRGLSTLLTMYHKMCPTSVRSKIIEQKNITFQFGDLVSVRLEPNGETRRGLVTATTLLKNYKENAKGSHSHHGVYLIDYGINFIVPKSCLLALPEPFHCIGPLAIKATLFGISSVAEIWDSLSIRKFKEKVKSNQLQQMIFSIEVMSRTTSIYGFRSKDSPLLVNLEVRQKSTKKHIYFTPNLHVNFTEELVKEKRGIPWNLFPSRPKIMEGTDMLTTITGGTAGVIGIFRFTISFCDGILITPYHPVMSSRLCIEALERDITKLLRLRWSYPMDTLGIENVLLMLVKEENKNQMKVCLASPCTIVNQSTSVVMCEDEKTVKDDITKLK